MITLHTERLILRPWLTEDYELFYKMSVNPLVSEFLPPFANEKESDAFVDHLRSDFAHKGWGFWVVENKESGRFMGISGIHEPGPEFGVGYPCIELGWRLAPEYWGKGFATEAGKEILRFAFVNLVLSSVISFIAKDNKRSIAVAQRLGMSFERQFDLKLFPFGHPHRLHDLYCINMTQWAYANIK